MRIFFRKPEINPTLSELFYDLPDTVPERNNDIKTPPELAKDNTRSIKSKKTSGLHKCQRIEKSNVKTISNPDKKTIKSLQAPSAENEKQKAENEIFERKMRQLTMSLMKRLKSKEADLDKLDEKYQAAARKMKSLEGINLAHQKALKIYRDELRAHNINKNVNFKSSIFKGQ